jgi:hypothetical protein
MSTAAYTAIQAQTEGNVQLEQVKQQAIQQEHANAMELEQMRGEQKRQLVQETHMYKMEEIKLQGGIQINADIVKKEIDNDFMEKENEKDRAIKPVGGKK